MSGDPFDLARFVAAQDPVIDQVRRELEAGRKSSHWMWFIFPSCVAWAIPPLPSITPSPRSTKRAPISTMRSSVIGYATAPSWSCGIPTEAPIKYSARPTISNSTLR